MTGPVLEVRDLGKQYPGRRSLPEVLRRQPVPIVTALDGVSFSVEPGEVLAIVGESGCGKTTAARLLLGLERPTHGWVAIDGDEVATLGRRELKQLRRRVQVVFQDPYESLNPRRSVAEAVEEPLRVHGVPAGERQARVTHALDQAGLAPASRYLGRLPHELSGGQRQRVSIAVALVLRPRVLVADEPVSMLDVSTRAEILNLLARLAGEHDLAVVMITHDLSTVAAYSDRLAVMYLGRVVETGPTRQVLDAPRHPYTRALLSVVPVADPRRRHEPTILAGEAPDPSRLPTGCRFHPRCPAVIEECRAVDPALEPVGPAHRSACLRNGEVFG